MPDPIDRIADGGTATVSESSCEFADVDSGVVNIAVLERTLAEGTETETGLQHFAGVARTNRRLSESRHKRPRLPTPDRPRYGCNRMA